MGGGCTRETEKEQSEKQEETQERAMHDIQRQYCRRRTRSTDGNSAEKSSAVRTGKGPLALAI